MARGDILIARIPAQTGPTGHEQIGTRPAIVVQADHASSNLSTTMIIPMTTNVSASRYPNTIDVAPSPQNGLASRSILLVFQLRAIDNGRLGMRIGRLEHHHMQQLETEMRDLLGL